MATRRRPQPQPTAAQQARKFFADPTMRLAAEAARRGEDWTRVNRAAIPRPAAGPRALRPVHTAAQQRAALSGRPVKAQPTKRQRAVRRRVRKLHRQTVNAFAAIGGLTLLTLFLALVVVGLGRTF